MSTAEPDPHADDIVFYAPGKKIFPKEIAGQFRRIKWGIQIATLAIYYFLPFLRWDRGPGMPSQAVMLDLSGRRFYFFFIEIWPQEFYYATGLLIVAALTLFLMNALAGRIWCGYMCPQTVWTDFYLTAERFVEGDSRERMKLDAAPWTAEKIRKRALKHFLWLLIAWWTGGVWVLYFADAPTLVYKLATFAPGSGEPYMWIGVFTFMTYVLAGHMREQVCLYMCPWPRIQAALTDEYALNVTYRVDRGEPRMSLKAATAARAHGAPAGDCVDCGQCVAVCPTGVDIRHGADLGCIQCGLCIDACDSVMEKIGRPTRLIAYDTQMNLERRACGKPAIYKPLRARTIIYAVLIAVIGGFILVNLAVRGDARLSALHDRNPLTVRLKDGGVRNAYALRFVNMKTSPRKFALSVVGLDKPQIEVVGVAPRADGSFVIEVGADQTREARVLITLHGAAGKGAQTPIGFLSKDVETGVETGAKDVFIWP